MSMLLNVTTEDAAFAAELYDKFAEMLADVAPELDPERSPLPSFADNSPEIETQPAVESTAAPVSPPNGEPSHRPRARAPRRHAGRASPAHSDQAHTLADGTDSPSGAIGSTPGADRESVVRLAALIETLTADIRRLTDERAELFGRVGYYQAQLEQARDTIKLLEAPKPGPVKRHRFLFW